MNTGVYYSQCVSQFELATFAMLRIYLYLWLLDCGLHRPKPSGASIC